MERRLALERSGAKKTLTLSEYMAERWSRRSDMVSLVFRTIISIPGNLRRRTSVSAIPGCQRSTTEVSIREAQEMTVPYHVVWTNLSALPRVGHRVENPGGFQ